MSQYQQQPNPPYPPQQQGPQGPPPPGWGPQMVYAPPPPPKKKRRGLKILLGVAAVIVVIAVASSLSGGGDDPSTTGAQGQAGESTDSESEAAAGIGDKVRDGKFEFTVTDIESGVKKIGPKFLAEKAQGQFVLVHVTVENIGDEAQYLSATDQYLYDQDSRQHSADDGAWIVLEDNPLLEQINPGNKVDGIVVFDIPKNAKPKSLELHDSMFSDGISVAAK